MLSFSRRFLFIHIPKTAGNAVQGVLRAYADDEIVTPKNYQDGIERFEVSNPRFPQLTKHSTMGDYKRALGRSAMGGLFKFTCIRNPWDRMISYYFSPHRGVATWDRDGFVRLVAQTPDVFEYLGQARRSWLFRGKHSRLADIDFVMRYEQLEDDFRHVCSVLDIPYTPLAVRNRSQRQHYTEYYDHELIEQVSSKFRREIDFAGYTFG